MQVFGGVHICSQPGGAKGAGRNGRAWLRAWTSEGVNFWCGQEPTNGNMVRLRRYLAGASPGEVPDWATAFGIIFLSMEPPRPPTQDDNGLVQLSRQRRRVEYLSVIYKYARMV